MVLTIETKPSAITGLSLMEAPRCTPLKVIEITGNDWTRSRLSSMGILPGATVMVIQNNKGGPLLLKVKGSRVALGKKIADMIKVGL